MFDNDKIWETVIALTLSAIGGFARLLHLKDKQKLSLVHVLSNLFISAFAGIMVLFLARKMGLTGDWLGFLAGMAGWLGPNAITALEKKYYQITGTGKDSSENKTDKEDK